MYEHRKMVPENRALPVRGDATDSPGPAPQVRIFAVDSIPEGLDRHWLILCSSTSEANIFYEPALLSAAFRHLKADEPIGLFTLWSGTPLESELIALVPLADMPRYSHWPLPHVQNWKHPNCFLGAPLVRKGHETAFWQALLNHLDNRKGQHGFLHMNGMVRNGPLLGALQELGQMQKRQVDIVHHEGRALLENVADAESYYAATVRSKKRKELRRLRNRLDEQGHVTFYDSADTGITADGLGQWVQEFLALEKAGWKGDNDSALACSTHTRNFFTAALEAARDNGSLHLTDMRLDGKPIAMLVNFKSGRGGFSFKTAFDERYARYSPGVLLQIENLSVLGKLGTDWMDSCAAEGHPMIDSLWSARRDVVRVSVALSSARNRAYYAGIRLAEASMTYIKSLLRKDRT